MIRTGIVADRQQAQPLRVGGELRSVRRLIVVCLIALAAAGFGLVTTVFNTTTWFNAKSGEIERQWFGIALSKVLAARPDVPASVAARELAIDFMLQDARVSSQQGSADLELSIRLPGDAPAYLVWTAPALGTAGMLNFAPTRVPLILGVVAAAGLLLFRLNRLARALDRERQAASELASTDMLTGLGNRRAFHEELAERLKDGRTFALACIDLDGFKAVNDRYGHAAGDAVLSGVARRLDRILGPGDHGFRLGGDEFALLLPSEGRDMVRFVKKIMLALNDSYELDPHTRARVGASVGVAFAPIDATEGQRLISRADTALYLAKEERSSTYRFAGKSPAAAMVSAA
jgi:diguanylate cyclase (GGDEF)-like protein